MLFISSYFKLAAGVRECVLFKLKYSDIRVAILNTLYTVLSVIVSVCLKQY